VYELRSFWCDEIGNKFGSIGNLEKLISENGDSLIFATNVGIYTPEWNPQGLYVEFGNELIPIDLGDGYGNFYMKPNGVFLIGLKGAKIIESTHYAEIADSIIFATQSGPLLVIDNKIHPAFNEDSQNRYIRNGVGINTSGEIVFAISNEEMNLYNFASLFRDKLDCENALYLDGAISQMYLPELGRFELGGSFAVIIAVMRNSQPSVEFIQLSDSFYVQARADHNYWWGLPNVIHFLGKLRTNLQQNVFTRVAIGDISRKNGDVIMGHKSHKEGRDIDIYFINKNKLPMGRRDTDMDGDGEFDSMRAKGYSRENSMRMIEILIATDIINDGVTVETIFCEDTLINRELNEKYKTIYGYTVFQWWEKHDDHFHVRFKSNPAINLGF
jgi:uncharacterized protein YigE (DUF2233 family)